MQSHGYHQDRRSIARRLSIRAGLSSAVRGMRAAAAAAAVISLAACSSFSSSHESPGSAAVLQSNLSVATAALAAGQPAVARRIYVSLAERFDDAPEPVLGLAYVALQNNDLDAASRTFLQAAGLAEDAPEIRAEALLGAGRTALARGDTGTARQHLEEAQALAEAGPSSIWIENGLAVTAVLESDFTTAEAHYTRALRQSSGHPRIAANMVRMLLASGRTEEAARLYERHDPSYWEEHDGRALPLLIEEAADTQSSLLRMNGDLLLQWTSFEAVPLPLPHGFNANAVGSLQLAGTMGLALRLADESALVAPSVSDLQGAIATPVALSSATAAAPPAEPALHRNAGGPPESDLAPQADERQADAPPAEGFAVLLGQSQQWQLDGDAQAVATADPGIADVQLLSPDVLYVIGRQVGRTSVVVLGEDGRVWKEEVSVMLDLEPLHALLGQDPELDAVRARSVPRGVALAGEVDSPAIADRALRLAAASFPEGTLVENDMRVTPDLEPLRTLLAVDSDMAEVSVREVARGVALTGTVGSMTAAERAARLAAASLPEETLVENNLRVEIDPEPLRALLAGQPDMRDVRVEALSRGVALAGEVGSAAAADRALRLAAASFPEETLIENGVHIAGPQQVNLEVQIAEVQRSVSEDLGLNWEVFGSESESDVGFGFQIGRDATLRDDNGRNILEIVDVDGVPSPILGVQKLWNDFSVVGVIDMLAQAGLANVLARPNVTAISGETASFFSGGEYPLPTGYQDGTVTYTYRKYGVLLDFVPTVIDENRIELTVRPEVSEPSQDRSIQIVTGINIPVINVRRAETTVEVADGESIVIAGLFRSATNEIQSGLPYLKDLPMLGPIFGHSATRSDELELIVTVTARLVQAGPAPDAASVASAPGRANNYYY